MLDMQLGAGGDGYHPEKLTTQGMGFVELSRVRLKSQ